MMRPLNSEQSLRQRGAQGKLQAPQRLHRILGALMRDACGQNSRLACKFCRAACASRRRAKYGPHLARIEAGASAHAFGSPCIDVEEIAVFNGFYDDFGELTAGDLRASGSANFAGKRALFAARACML
jgi:hypothetical protein